MFLLQFLMLLAEASLLAALFYRLGKKDGYEAGTRYSQTHYETGRRDGYELASREAKVQYDAGYRDGWAYRQKRMGGGS